MSDNGAAVNKNRAGRRAGRLILALVLACRATSGAHAAGDETVTAVAGTEAVAVAGNLELVMRHTMGAGRVIVRLGGNAFLSAPFVAAAGAVPALFERALSVPAGRHPVEISVLDTRGRVVARNTTLGTVPEGAPVILQVEEHRGQGAGLTLTWKTP